MIIPSYYCPHCGNFKHIFQVSFNIFGREICKHCGRDVVSTKEHFTKFIDNHLVDYESIVNEIMMLDRVCPDGRTPLVYVNDIKEIIDKYEEKAKA